MFFWNLRENMRKEEVELFGLNIGDNLKKMRVKKLLLD